MKLLGAQQPFEMRGVFWLPEAKDQRLSGTLHFAPSEGVRLRLIGKLGEFCSCLNVVHGIVEDAECTLFTCTAEGFTSSALILSEFRADIAIIGAHVSSMKEALFFSAKVRFDCLDDWVHFSAFSFPVADRLSGRPPSRFDINEQVSVSANVGAQGCAISLVGDQQGTISSRYINWEHHSFLHIAWSNPVSLHDLCWTVSELRHLIALLTWQRVHLAYLCIANKKVPASYHGSGCRWCGIFGAVEPQGGAYSASHWMLTDFSDVQAHFPVIAEAWFAGDKSLRDARGLLTGLIESEGQFMEFEFLALVQIVEALHRIKSPRRYMADADYEFVKSALTAAIPAGLGEDHRQSLRSRIKYGNELSLRTRLIELLLDVPDNLRSVLATDPRSFTSEVVDGRNYLTHRDEDLASRELKPEQLRQTCQRLKLLLTVHFLHSLGMPFAALERLSHDRDWYSRHIAS